MADPVEQLPLSLWEEMKPVFAAAFPKEAVVAIHGDKWRQLENVSPKPTYGFALNQSDKASLLTRPPTLFLHSHPSPPASAEPSDRDTEQQLETGWNWGIVAVTGNAEGKVYDVAYPECWGPGIAVPALVGRQYLWGIRDCWTLCRDWYRLNGWPDMPNVPRARVPDHYPPAHWGRDQFGHWPAKLGFKPVARHERQPGDCALFKMRGSVFTHCAIYLGDGKYLHQLENQLSTEWIPHNEEAVFQRWNIQFVRPPKQR